MADREHPKKHQDTGSRKQPLSPQHEGIDPLTEGDTLYPREDVKGEAEKGREDREKQSTKRTQELSDKSAQTYSDQEAVEKNAGTENDTLTEEGAGDSQDTTTDSKGKTSSKSKK